MTLLTPLGLLGLLSIIVLIIIYIIKPNYQQKFISSTFVWKLSLKYRKKRIPTSKLRNILIIVCQILILTSCALILAQPNQVLKAEVKEREVVLVIDASASMRAESNGETRFERAVDGATEMANSVFSQNGIVSVVFADSTATFLARRVTAENKIAVTDALEPLLDEDMACSYGTGDVEGAIDLCKEIVEENPSAEVYLYTDTKYSYAPEEVKMVSVTDSEEWNAAILNAYAELSDGYYTFIVDVACYGRDTQIAVELEVHGANATNSEDVGLTIPLVEYVECSRDQTQRIIFINSNLYKEEADTLDNVVYHLIDESEAVYAYQSVHISIDEEDCLSEDNSFNIYSGQKEVLKIQYVSRVEDPSSPSGWLPTANPFFAGVLYTLEAAYENVWDFEIKEVKTTEEPEMEGFDLYIFEHTMPSTLPKDGIVLLVNPNSAPTGAGFRVGSSVSLGAGTTLTASEPHEILDFVTPENITISNYIPITYYDPSYQVLLTCNNRPVLMVKDDVDTKIMVMAFSVHYSNVTLSKDFPILMYNFFEHFFPATVDGNAFEVNEKVEVNARGTELVVSLNDKILHTFTQFPSSLVVSTPGTYELLQTTFSGKNVTESIYVKIPAIESNVWYEEETLENPYGERDEDDFFKDLMVYVAAALVLLLFVEWWLQSRETM